MGAQVSSSTGQHLRQADTLLLGVGEAGDRLALHQVLAVDLDVRQACVQTCVDSVGSRR